MKGRVRPMLEFKMFYNARRVIIGIELAGRSTNASSQFRSHGSRIPRRSGGRSWQHSPHRHGALLVLSLRQSYLHQNPYLSPRVRAAISRLYNSSIARLMSWELLRPRRARRMATCSVVLRLK